ncbi:hypothetical protein Scep_011180 [Stephania cephalantha]|uniref:Secreted protein n=1 Tax=Stephania cephalantha TaxID=152367 RepID=A0AAP0JCG8_9MAGN
MQVLHRWSLKVVNLLLLLQTHLVCHHQQRRQNRKVAFEQFGNLFVAVSSKVLHSITTSMPVVSSLPSPSKGGNPSSSAKKVKKFLLLYFAKAVHLEEETL